MVLTTFHRRGQDDIFIAAPGTRSACSSPLRQDEVRCRLRHVTTIGYFKSGERVRLDPRLLLRWKSSSRPATSTTSTGGRRVNQIQIKVRPGFDLDQLSRWIQVSSTRCRPMFFQVQTWEQKQGPLLGAVAVEQSILNILLFFIIAVAGFGILAIFSMIVVEKRVISAS